MMKQAGSSIIIVYLVGCGITLLMLVVMSRVKCFQDDGFIGIFWCTESVIGAFSFKAFIWPYLLFEWLSS